MTTRGAVTTLSSSEEVTLRRVALGYADRGVLPIAHVRHLIQLKLIVDFDGVLSLTGEGRQRYDKLSRPSGPIGDALPDELQRLLSMLTARPR